MGACETATIHWQKSKRLSQLTQKKNTSVWEECITQRWDSDKLPPIIASDDVEGKLVLYVSDYKAFKVLSLIKTNIIKIIHHTHYYYHTDTASLHHPTAGQRPIPTTSRFLDLGLKWTTGCWSWPTRPAIFFVFWLYQGSRKFIKIIFFHFTAIL